MHIEKTKNSSQPFSYSCDAGAELLFDFLISMNNDDCRRISRLALLVVYKALTKNLKRYEGYSISSSINNSHAKLNSTADLDIRKNNNQLFEAVELTFSPKWSLKNVASRIQTEPCSRYYILSFRKVGSKNQVEIENKSKEIYQKNKCELLVDDFLPTLKGYMRTENDSYKIIQQFTKILQNDKTVKFEHKEAWNEIIANL